MPKTVKNPKHKTQTQTQNLTPKPKPKPKTLIRFKILLNLIIKKFLSHFYRLPIGKLTRCGIGLSA